MISSAKMVSSLGCSVELALTWRYAVAEYLRAKHVEIPVKFLQTPKI